MVPLFSPDSWLGIGKPHNLHNIAQLAPSLSPQQHRPPPSSSKDATDVLWQRLISHKCHPPWQPPRQRSMSVTVVAPAAKCSCCNHCKHHLGDAVGGGSGRGGAGIGRRSASLSRTNLGVGSLAVEGSKLPCEGIAIWHCLQGGGRHQRTLHRPTFLPGIVGPL